MSRMAVTHLSAMGSRNAVRLVFPKLDHVPNAHGPAAYLEGLDASAVGQLVHHGRGRGKARPGPVWRLLGRIDGSYGSIV